MNSRSCCNLLRFALETTAAMMQLWDERSSQLSDCFQIKVTAYLLTTYLTAHQDIIIQGHGLTGKEVGRRRIGIFL